MVTLKKLAILTPVYILIVMIILTHKANYVTVYQSQSSFYCPIQDTQYSVEVYTMIKMMVTQIYLILSQW